MHGLIHQMIPLEEIHRLLCYPSQGRRNDVIIGDIPIFLLPAYDLMRGFAVDKDTHRRLSRRLATQAKVSRPYPCVWHADVDVESASYLIICNPSMTYLYHTEESTRQPSLASILYHIYHHMVPSIYVLFIFIINFDNAMIFPHKRIIPVWMDIFVCFLSCLKVSQSKFKFTFFSSITPTPTPPHTHTTTPTTTEDVEMPDNKLDSNFRIKKFFGGLVIYI